MQTAISINNEVKSGGGDAPAAMPGGFHPFTPVLSDGGGAYHDAHRRRSPEMDRRISIHEAAHAAVGRLLGMPVAGSTINSVGGFSGMTWASDEHRDGPDETLQLVDQLAPLMDDIGDSRAGIAAELLRAQHLVISLLAGSLAEELFCSEVLPGSEHDWIEARAISELITRSPRSVDSYLDFCCAEARALLTNHRNILLALADALLKFRTMTGEQIDDVIRAALFCQTLEAGR